MTKIYTKIGDDGATSLMGGVKVSKFDETVELLGTLDELNCWLGWSLSNSVEPEDREPLLRTQHQLFLLGAMVAGDRESTKRACAELPDWVSVIETEIDQMSDGLPPLRNFVLPGGDRLAAMLHLARAVARRTERVFFRWQSMNPDESNQQIGVYLNRLGDWLFTIARRANVRVGTDEVIWGSGSRP